MKWRTKTTRPPGDVEPTRRHDATGSRAGVFRPLGDFAPPPPPPSVTALGVGEKTEASPTPSEDFSTTKGSKTAVVRPLGSFVPPPPAKRNSTAKSDRKRDSVVPAKKEVFGMIETKPGVFRPLEDFAPPPPPPSRISTVSVEGRGAKFSSKWDRPGVTDPKVGTFRPLEVLLPPPPLFTSTAGDAKEAPTSRSAGDKRKVPPPPPRDSSPVKTKPLQDDSATKSSSPADKIPVRPPTSKDKDSPSKDYNSNNKPSQVQENSHKAFAPKEKSPTKSLQANVNNPAKSASSKDNNRVKPGPPKETPYEVDNPLKISLPEPPAPSTYETVQIVVNPRVSSGAAASTVVTSATPTTAPAPIGSASSGVSAMATFRSDGRCGGELRDRDEEIYENSPAFRLVPVTTDLGYGARLRKNSQTGSTTIQLNGDLISRVEVPSSHVDTRLTTTVLVTSEPDSRLHQDSEPHSRLNGSTIVIQSAENSTSHVKSDRDARLTVSGAPPVARVSPMTDDRLRLTPDSSSVSPSPLSRSSSHCTERSNGTGSTYNLPQPATPLGSTDKLIHNGHAQTQTQFTPATKYKVSSGWLSACGQVVTVLSLAVGFGNVFRLPRAVYLNGGGAFLFAYVVLTLVLGLPLVFLEMGLGQFCEEGVTKLYRAVPLFRGVGYVKVLSSVLLAIYYPILMALSLFYTIWTAKGPLPFAECNHTFIGEVVYHHTILGEECLKNTFLRPPKDDGMWFGVNVALMFFIWSVIMLCLFKHGSSLRVATYVLSVPAVLCLVALISESIVQDSSTAGLDTLLAIDWEKLLDIKVWYFATIQMFFSTHLGLGNIVTSAGRLYPQSNAFWTAALYIVCNLLFGLLSVILTYYWVGRLTTEAFDPKMPEVWLLTLLYDVANQAFGEDRQIWAAIGFLGFLLSGFVAMVWLVFTILEVMTIELGPKGSWEPWQRTGVVCAVGFLVGVPALLPYELELVHILDHYVIGRIVIATVILELIAIAWIYGSGTLYIDFEFILGYRLNPYWKLIWWVTPLLLLTIEIWSLVSLPLTGIAEQMPDPVWVFATGWTLYLSMWVIILITAVYQITRQIDYNLAGRLLSTLKPSRKWGPQDTMYRHNWHQWRKQTVDGERDYTLKRRGTKDYTHSLKRPLRQATGENTIRSVKQPYSIQVPYNEADHVCWRGHNEHA